MSRILVLLQNSENLRLLSAMLSRSHELVALNSPDTAFDLAIVDAPSLKAHAEFLAARKREEDPVLLPVLLVTTRQNIGLYVQPLSSIVDEVVLTPVEKLELSARLEMLLRARRLSLELRLRKDDLEAFIHAMTHDLRAPLRTVAGFADAMAEDQLSHLDAAGKHQLERIQAAVRDMWDLIESLVEFARIGRRAVKLRSVSLDEVVRMCLDQMRGQIESRKAEVRIVEALGRADADPALLKIAICNLVSNGIKYVEKDVTPHLEISARQSGKITCLLFHDNGIGLKPEDQQRIFTPFVRLHGVEDYPGVGLGLSATRKIVEIMGGQVGVNSTPGQGSTFWVQLQAGEKS